MTSAEESDRKAPRHCPHCGRETRPMANFYTHVEVLEGPGGAVSTRVEERLEYLCTWCGRRLAPGAAVTVDDTDPL
jgi:predicted RNA-binding Zn-ribbon protein involved in translation (DUF1610 family)